MKNKIAAVVVTYNRKELLKENIESLLTQKPDVPDILIVDNHSTDGTKEFIREYIDNGSIEYCDTGANLGGAGGFSFGMRKAVELGYEFVWVMDDDTMPESDALKNLLEADKKHKGNYGWLSSVALWKDGTPCRMNIQKITKWKPLKDFDKTQKIQYATFVSLFLKAETIKEYGLPYKEFFIWGDDWEYTRRISKEKPCFLVPGSVVCHECKTNTGADIVTAEPERLDRFRYSYRNDAVIYRQDGIGGFAYLVLRIAKHAAKIILQSDNKSQKLKLMFQSLGEGMKFKPEREYP